MKILIINVVCGIRSTGRICTDLAQSLEAEGHEVKIAYGRETVPEQFQKYAVRIGNSLTEKVNALSARCFDNEGLNAIITTKRFLRWADSYNPDLVWLHNIHGYYINYELLFSWIKSKPNIQVKWTLHDCWTFTGHCTHFSFLGCNKWKTGCNSCPQKNLYPASYMFDSSESNYKMKKNSFLGVNDLTIYTPSKWLANLVKQSFFSEYPIEVLYNEVDSRIFKKTDSNFRAIHQLEKRIIVLGVASSWTERKGLYDFIELSKHLDDRFKIVLVGLDERQLKEIPKNILGISKTNNVEELVKIYSTADVFVNPSYEETFGLTTVEANLCGTKTIVYKDTACEEISEMYGGVIVERGYINILNELNKMFCRKEN